MSKILVIVHVGRHLRLFSHADAHVYKNMGHEVHFASNFTNEKDRYTELDSAKFTLHQIDFSRNIFSINNIKAFFQLKKLIKIQNFDIIHTHMNIGGVIGRLAANKQTKIVHTSHGFAFYDSNYFLKNVLFKSLELLLLRKTDFVITMNQEDYEFIIEKKKKFKLKGVYKVPGVGVDFSKYNETKRNIKINKDDGKVTFITIGELTKRKNHIEMIKIFNYLDENTQLLICGTGALENKLKNYVAKIGLSQRISFLGYRNDVFNLLLNSNFFLFTSKTEGLPVSVIEAMSCGLPIIANPCRGVVDLVKNDKNGLLIDSKDGKAAAEKIQELINSKYKTDSMSMINSIESQKYDKKNIENLMKEIYFSIIESK